MPPEAPRIFISYSHTDEVWKERLAQHLTVAQDRLDVWDDRRIQAGDDWRQKIEEALAGARVAVLLISKDSLNSKFIRDQEVPTILERRGAGLRVIPVIVPSALSTGI